MLRVEKNNNNNNAQKEDFEVLYGVRAYLHGTTLSHATSLRHELFRVNQTYNSLTTLKSCRRPVVSLSHATKSCRVNRP